MYQREKSKAERIASRKGRKDMTALNRIYSLNNYSYKLAFDISSECEIIFVPSYKTKHMRENVALIQILKE